MVMEDSIMYKFEIFNGLSQQQRQMILDTCDRKALKAEEIVFREDDQGDSMWIIESGTVEIYTTIRENVNKTITLLSEGQVFGEMSFLEGMPRTASAKTTSASVLLLLSLGKMLKSCGNDTALLSAFYLNIAKILSKRLRQTNEMLKAEIAWNFEAMGAAALNLHRLAENLTEITVLLKENLEVSGRLLQFDNSPAGYNLILKTKDDHIQLIPFHAILSIYVQ